MRLIKKYKNRRLYDTELSQYITLEQLQNYVIDGVIFKVEDAEGADLTNAVLLQIIVEMEAGTTPFFSADLLRQMIQWANHPMHASFKQMMEHMVGAMNQAQQTNPYQTASSPWTEPMQEAMMQWTKLFK